MIKLTATEILNKLKLTKKQIEDAQSRLLVGYLTTSDKNVVPAGFKDQEAFKKEAQSRLDRVQDLIKKHQKYKKALVHSNATTNVQVGSQTMTVAEAIERKASIVYEKKIINSLKDNWNKLSGEMERFNGQALEVKADAFINGMPKEAHSSENERFEARKRFIEKNVHKFVGLEDLTNKIQAMENSVHQFESTVDTALSVCNATTILEVDD